MYPKIFQKLIDNFSSLPSVGPKMAERLVLFLFKQNREKLIEFSKNLQELKNLKHCKRCFNISENDHCSICENKQRESSVICVVEDPLDIISIEKTNIYKGMYFVLGGTIDSNKKNLKITQLLKKISTEKPKEIIIATNPTSEGDLTALYLKRKLQDFKNLKITRLGRGMSTGGDIEYADELTLSSAIANRKKI